MSFIRTTAINKILQLTKPVKIIQGGTSAGKTYGILPILIDKAIKNPNLEISVVSETIPHLRRGALKDFLKILQATGRYNPKNYNKTLLTYTFSNGSTIEFFSADQEDKLRGARRDILYVNEANLITWPAYHQLSIRTKKEEFIDYNPTNEFWAHKELLQNNDSELLILTYKDNEALDNRIINKLEQAIEKSKTSKYWENWVRVYVYGHTGIVEGLVFKEFEQVAVIPQKYKWKIYGLDFGYTNDPTAIIEVAFDGGKIYLNELVYSTDMKNKDICDKLESLEIDHKSIIIADSAEPKSIDEIYYEGFRMIKPANKGKDSIKYGINLMDSYPIAITENSVNLIKEFRNYKYDRDKDGNWQNTPIDDYNHGIDAARYAVSYKLRKNTASFLDEFK